MIAIERLSKKYELGAQIERHQTLRDAIARKAATSLDRLRPARSSAGSNGDPRTIWALRDVSFEVEQGDVVGVIGRNGAGKSTLLKVLSRVTEPSEGRVRMRGRVGSLLEVGTGFHPELTGRENIFLNGAILGMRKTEIERRFDEIVDFAEVLRFLDTPVKRYSSGMTVRLAFAVAAHLEPEILLVDEVLAVGDVAFQRKCIGKMTEVAGEGRTVLFVSHNMAVIQSLCRRGIFLERGVLRTDGTISEAVATYLGSIERAKVDDLSRRTDRRGIQDARLVRIEIGSSSNGDLLATGRPARFVFHTTGTPGRLSCTFTIVNTLGLPVATLSSAAHGPLDSESVTGPGVFVCEIDELPLVPGRYRIDVEIQGRSFLQDAIEGAASFDVEQGTLAGRPVAGDAAGDVAIAHRWLSPSLD